jgi:hypothetical protein
MEANIANGRGGGIFTAIQNSVVSGSSAIALNLARSGGGIYHDSDGHSVTFQDTAFLASTNDALHGPLRAGPGVRLNVTVPLPKDYTMNAGDLVEPPLTVELLDEYDQLVATDYSSVVFVSPSFTTAPGGLLSVEMLGRPFGQLIFGSRWVQKNARFCQALLALLLLSNTHSSSFLTFPGRTLNTMTSRPLAYLRHRTRLCTSESVA